MDTFSSFFMLFLLTLIGIVIIGGIAGFSPALSLARAAMHSKKVTRVYIYSRLFGFLTALVILLILFQSFSLGTLLRAIDSPFEALLTSVIFNIIIGLLFVFAGLRYISTKDDKKAYESTVSQPEVTRPAWKVFRSGFLKTFLSISSTIAIFIGGNIIASSSATLLERSILTIAFLAASVAPFLAIFYFLSRNQTSLQNYLHRVQIRLTQINYRLSVGVGAILFGGAIVIFNIMMALFY